MHLVVASSPRVALFLPVFSLEDADLKNKRGRPPKTSKGSKATASTPSTKTSSTPQQVETPSTATPEPKRTKDASKLSPKALFEDSPTKATEAKTKPAEEVPEPQQSNLDKTKIEIVSSDDESRKDGKTTPAVLKECKVEETKNSNADDSSSTFVSPDSMETLVLAGASLATHHAPKVHSLIPTAPLCQESRNLLIVSSAHQGASRDLGGCMCHWCEAVIEKQAENINKAGGSADNY